MRRPKFPKNRKLRKKLIRYLAKEGYTVFDIKLLVGYSLEALERNRFEFGLASGHEKRLLKDDEYRENVVNSLLDRMREV